MPKLTKKAIRNGRTDGRTYRRTDPNYRKASFNKCCQKSYRSTWTYGHSGNDNRVATISK